MINTLVDMTTADIVIVVVLVIILLALVAYFAFRKYKGKKLTDCGCGGTDSKSLVKKYFKKYPKDEKNHECCHKH